MTKIKLCGMMQPEDVITAAGLGADYAGFILSEGFRRTVVLETFCELASCLDSCGSGTKKVGVFVDEPIENIMRYYAEKLDIIQLHGNETNDYITKLKGLSGKPVIKAFRIQSDENIERARKSKADYVLLDSGTGTGKTFDHSLIKNIDRPYFLAGGLTAENISEAIRTLHPFAVDASSCLETNGQKDKNKMAAFVNAVRGKDR